MRDSSVSSSDYLVPWSGLPDRATTEPGDLYLFWLETSLYVNYLKDVLLDERKTPSEQLQRHRRAILALAKQIQLEGHAAVNDYWAQIHRVMDICGRIPTSTGWDKAYEGFIWLVSKRLGSPYVILIGCAIKQRGFRLRSADQAKLFAFLTTEKQSLYCDALAEVARSSQRGIWLLFS